MNRFVVRPTPIGHPAPAALATAFCLLAAACSTNGGESTAMTAGDYRTGPVGRALSDAASRRPAELARVQERLGRNSASARPSERPGGARSEAGDSARSADGSRLAKARPAQAGEARTDARSQAFSAGSAEPMPAGGRDRAGSAPTQQTILAPALSGAAAPAAGLAVRPAPVNRALAVWSLSAPQTAVLGLGLLLACLAAALAAWGAARRPRAAFPGPAVSSPRPAPANDTGRVEPAPAGGRAVGPQYVLPLSPAAAAARSYSFKAGGTAKLNAPRR